MSQQGMRTFSTEFKTITVRLRVRLPITVTLYSITSITRLRITVTLYSTPNCPPRLGPAAPWARIAAVPWRRGDRGKGGEPSGRPIGG